MNYQEQMMLLLWHALTYNWRVKRLSWLLALLVSWLMSVAHLMSDINSETISWLLSVVQLISGCSN